MPVLLCRARWLFGKVLHFCSVRSVVYLGCWLCFWVFFCCFAPAPLPLSYMCVKILLCSVFCYRIWWNWDEQRVVIIFAARVRHLCVKERVEWMFWIAAHYRVYFSNVPYNAYQGRLQGGWGVDPDLWKDIWIYPETRYILLFFVKKCVFCLQNVNIFLKSSWFRLFVVKKICSVYCWGKKCMGGAQIFFLTSPPPPKFNPVSASDAYRYTVKKELRRNSVILFMGESLILFRFCIVEKAFFVV